MLFPSTLGAAQPTSPRIPVLSCQLFFAAGAVSGFFYHANWLIGLLAAAAREHTALWGTASSL